MVSRRVGSSAGGAALWRAADRPIAAARRCLQDRQDTVLHAVERQPDGALQPLQRTQERHLRRRAMPEVAQLTDRTGPTGVSVAARAIRV